MSETMDQAADVLDELKRQMRLVPMEHAACIAGASALRFQGELIGVLEDVRAVVAASAQASHFFDGIKIGADGQPCGAAPKLETNADRLLQGVDAALVKAEGR